MEQFSRRLRAIMAHLQMKTVQDLADHVGGTRSQVSNWLNAATSGNPPPVPYMLRLIELLPDLTLDWIYRGDADNLPHGLAVRLIALTEGDPTPSVPDDQDPEPPAQAPVADRDRGVAPKHRRRVQGAT